MTYQSKFQRSNSYTKAMEHNRIVVSEFGTMAHPDPCLSLLGRFMARFKPQREYSDNCNVNLAFVGDQCYAMTESHVLRKIDPRTLDTLDKVFLFYFYFFFLWVGVPVWAKFASFVKGKCCLGSVKCIWVERCCKSRTK